MIDTFLLLLIGIGPKLAMVPLMKLSASLDPPERAAVRRRMLTAAGITALVLILIGELLRVILHFTVGSLSVAGGIILLVLAVRMVLEQPEEQQLETAGRTPMQLALVPLAVPYLLNPVGIVALITISAEVGSLGVLAVEVAILAVVLLFDAVVFRWADRAGASLDEDRMLVIEKVFGFLIAAIAVQLVLDGLHSAGIVAHVPH